MQDFKYERNSVDSKLIEIAEQVSFALPRYKAENFVGGAQITPYAKLKQWLLELRGREDAVEHLEYTVQKQDLEIQIQEESKEFLTDAKLPDGSNLIDVIGNKDLENKFEHEYWTVRMAKQAMLDMVAYGRLGTGNLDSILMMSPEQQKQVLSLASSYTVFIDKNINQLMSNATTNSFSIEESLRNQLKLGEADKPDTEKLL